MWKRCGHDYPLPFYGLPCCGVQVLQQLAEWANLGHTLPIYSLPLALSLFQSGSPPSSPSTSIITFSIKHIFLAASFQLLFPSISVMHCQGQTSLSSVLHVLMCSLSHLKENNCRKNLNHFKIMELCHFK